MPPKNLIKTSPSQIFFADRALVVSKEDIVDWKPLKVLENSVELVDKTERTEMPHKLTFSMHIKTDRKNMLLFKWMCYGVTPPPRVKRKKKYKLRLISKWINRYAQ